MENERNGWDKPYTQTRVVLKAHPRGKDREIQHNEVFSSFHEKILHMYQLIP
jgi:hypothetical protein